MRLLQTITRTLDRFGNLKAEVGFFPALRWLIPTVLRQRSLLTYEIRGVPVQIRTVTPDLDVILASLCGEFDELLEKMPQLKHGLVIDAGGYIGTAAIVFAKQYPDATIVTVEPSPENFRMLEHYVRGYDNIVALNAAVTPSPGSMDLFDRGLGEWGYSLIADPSSSKGGRLTSVDCVTVDQILERHGKDGIDIFKIDIEGGEYALLSENSGWITKTVAICIELHDRFVDGCTELYHEVTQGRQNSQLEGEKFLSMAH